MATVASYPAGISRDQTPFPGIEADTLLKLNTSKKQSQDLPKMEPDLVGWDRILGFIVNLWHHSDTNMCVLVWMFDTIQDSLGGPSAKH